MRTIVVGSRQSALALTQTGQVIDDLKRLAKEHGLDYDFTVKNRHEGRPHTGCYPLQGRRQRIVCQRNRAGDDGRRD